MKTNHRTRIVSAFPGCGKSYYYNHHKETTLDSDSSLFSWTISENGVKERNKDFPENYISHIKENIGKYDYILVSSHEEVRQALYDECIFFYLVYPDVSDKGMYIERYKTRGSDDNFIKLINDNWEEWIHQLSFDEVGCKNISMPTGWTISTEIDHIEASELGKS